MSGFCIKSIRGGCGGGGGGNGGNNKCGRWNPTTEQVKVLTDLFRSGLRTPSTDQIQKISTQLSFYGKIESKNVFYWFQNHKARERQKRRKVSIDIDKEFIRPDHEKNITSPNGKKLINMNIHIESELSMLMFFFCMIYIVLMFHFLYRSDKSSEFGACKSD